jgi:hypothetical protein
MATTKTTSIKTPAATAAKAAPAKTVAKPAAKAPAKRTPAKVAAKPATVTPVVDGDACALPGAATDAPKKRYRLLTGPDDSNFCQKVSDALNDGYELYGSPSITFNGETAYAAQAVILKKLPKTKKKSKK